MGTHSSNLGKVQIQLPKTTYYIGEPIEGICSFERPNPNAKVFWGIQGFQEIFWIGKNEKIVKQRRKFYSQTDLIDATGVAQNDGKQFLILLHQKSQISTPSLTYQNGNCQINIYYEIFAYLDIWQKQDDREDFDQLQKHKIIFHMPFPNIQYGLHKQFNLPLYKHIFQEQENLQIKYELNTIYYKIGQDIHLNLDINNKNTLVNILNIEIDFILELRLRELHDSECYQLILFKSKLDKILCGATRNQYLCIPIKNDQSILQCSARTGDFFYQYFIRLKLEFDRYCTGSLDYEERIKINVYNS